jgi:hypothetical protein
VVATVRHSSPLSMVEYFLVPGSEPNPKLADLHARSRAGTVLSYLLGGRDADQAAQLHDVTSGAHTLCVDARLDPEQHLPLVCRAITVSADQRTLEIAIELP